MDCDVKSGLNAFFPCLCVYVDVMFYQCPMLLLLDGYAVAIITASVAASDALGPVFVVTAAVMLLSTGTDNRHPDVEDGKKRAFYIHIHTSIFEEKKYVCALMRNADLGVSEIE